MDFTAILKKKLGGRYDFLKLLKVVYNTTFCYCCITFIYPENINISDTQKHEVTEAVLSIVNIEGKVECKFIKSYLEKSIIIKTINEYLKQNHSSISKYFDENSIEFYKDSISVKLTLLCNKTIFNYIKSNALEESIKNYITSKFCGEFYVFAVLSESAIEFDESELNEINNIALSKINVEENKIIRYPVGEPMQVFGSEIMPLAEYINEQKGEKQNLILAGVVGPIEEREFLPRSSKKNGSDEKRKFYKFTLTDSSGSVDCVHFCTKISQKHFKLIEEGSHIICKGNYVKKNYGKGMQYIISSASICKQMDGTDYKTLNKPALTTGYKYVTPEPYIRTVQDNIFVEEPNYPDWIINNTFVVFDCETTGLEPQNNDITEIGAVKIVNGQIKEKFQHLCKPFEPIPDRIVSLTGITNQMVENMPSSYEILQDFLVFAKDATLVGYNVDFDYQFITNVARRNDDAINFPTHDCLVDARTKIEYVSNYKLGTIVAHLGITLDNAHRALFDALATAEAFLALNKLDYDENQSNSK